MVSRERERERAASATPLFPQEERGKEKEGKKEGKKGKEAGRKEAGARGRERGRERGEGTTKPKVSLARVARTRAHHGGEAKALWLDMGSVTIGTKDDGRREDVPRPLTPRRTSLVKRTPSMPACLSKSPPTTSL